MTETPRLFDTHAHLDFPQFIEDIDGVLTRAQDAGVERIITIGASRNLESNHRALELARKYEQIRCAAGIHPHNAAKCTEEVFTTIKDDFAPLPEVVAIGEIGLDYFYDYSPKDVQQEVFRRFLKLAKEIDKPVIIHSREAEEDTIRILKEVGVERAVVHCFTSSRKMANQIIDLGYHISFTGIVTFKNSLELLEIAADIPDDRIMIETDAPYLTPVPYRGRTNEPSFVGYTAAAIAEARGMPLREFAELTFQNACTFFDWPDASK